MSLGLRGGGHQVNIFHYLHSTSPHWHLTLLVLCWHVAMPHLPLLLLWIQATTGAYLPLLCHHWYQLSKVGFFVVCCFLCVSVFVVVFRDCSELFATSSKNDLRVWDSETRKELLRIVVPNMTCNAFSIISDGRSIVTGSYYRLVGWLVCLMVSNMFLLPSDLLVSRYLGLQFIHLCLCRLPVWSVHPSVLSVCLHENLSSVCLSACLAGCPVFLISVAIN